MMNVAFRVVPALMLALLLAGCVASQARPNRVGEVGFDVRHERALAAERAARLHYDYRAPKAAATIRSEPEGALIEWYNSDGMWVTVGTTPTSEIVIEATGKPELFRVSKEGYMPQSRWVASTSSGIVDVTFTLDPLRAGDQVLFRD